MATIKDVAELAGVSISSVSCVINNHKNVSLKTFEKITKAMKELNYRPSFFAQNLSSRKSPLLGVIVPNLYGKYESILNGVLNVAKRSNLHVIVKVSEYNQSLEQKYIQELKGIGVIGILIVPYPRNGIAYYLDWDLDKLPIIFLENSILNSSFTNITFDYRQIAKNLALKAFNKHDYSKCIIVTGNLNCSSQKEFYAGVTDALVLNKGINSSTEELVSFQIREENSVMYIDLLNHFSQIKDVSAIIFSDKTFYKFTRNILEKFNLNLDYYYIEDKQEKNLQKTDENEILSYCDHIKLGEIALSHLLNNMLDTTIEHKDIVIEEYKYPANTYKSHLAVNKNTSELNVLFLEANAVKSIELLKNIFENKTKCKVNIDSMPHNKLTQFVMEGGTENWEKYDVIMIDIPWMDYLISSGKLNDFSKNLYEIKPDINKIFPDRISKDLYLNKNDVYGVPIILTSGFLYYRKDLFENKENSWRFHEYAGYELRPPTNWSEYNVVSKFFGEEIVGKTDLEFGTAIPAKSPIALMEEFYVRQWAFGGKLLDSQKNIVVATIENTRATENLLAAYELSPPECINMFYEETFKLLLSGKIAMTQGFATHYLPYRYNIDEHNYHSFVDVAPIPGGKSMAGGWFLTISENSNKKALALEFILWCLSDEVALLNAQLGGAIPLKSIIENTSVQQKYPWWKIFDVNKIKLREKLFDQKNELVRTYDIEKIMSKELEKVLTKKQSVEDALQIIQKKLIELQKSEM